MEHNTFDKRKYDEFTNLYSLSKTLRFKLIPQGKTEYYFNERKLLEEDEQRAKDYERAKQLIDEQHKRFIEATLSNLKLIGLKEYVDLYFLPKRDTVQNKKLAETAGKLRKEISKAFTAQKEYKRIFLNGIIDENPTFRMVLGMCPTLAVTTGALNGLGMGLSTAAVLILSNTIKLAMYDRKDEIAIMKMVGATNSFIRLPFLLEGAVIGLVGAAIPLVPLWFFYDKVIADVSEKLSAFGSFLNQLRILHDTLMKQCFADIAVPELDTADTQSSHQVGEHEQRLLAAKATDLVQIQLVQIHVDHTGAFKQHQLE